MAASNTYAVASNKIDTKKALLEVNTLTGSATITDASQTETTPFALVTITPQAGKSLKDVAVYVDLAKATTGFNAIESSATIQLAVSRKVDGTNWRREAYVEAALSGTNAANRMQKLNVGTIGVSQAARIEVVMSADATGNIVIPYAVDYTGAAAPTLA